MSNAFEDALEKDMRNDRPPKCEVCGGYGYNFPPGQKSVQLCPSCHGTKISQKPRR